MPSRPRRFGPRRSLAQLFAIVALIGGLGGAAAADPPAKEAKLSLVTLLPALTPVSDYRGDLRSRAALLGDFGGKRQWLYERGVALDFMLTQAAQGVASGGVSKEWKYGATADYFLSLDSGRLDLWPGGLVGLHAESKFGRSANERPGNLSPVNADYLWPEPGEMSETFLSEYYLYQGLADGVVLLAGRVNWVGLADHNRFANNERTQFMNMSLRNTTLLGEFIPLTAHGAALVISPNEHVAMYPFVVSANDEPGTYGSPGGLFDEVTAGAEIDVSWEINGLPGTVRPGFAFDTGNPADLDSDHLLLDAAQGLPLPDKSHNWLFNFNFDQYLYMPAKPPESPRSADFEFNPAGLGVFFRFAFAPEDRNPFNMFVSGGLGGRGVVPGRPNDRWGLGFYSLIESDDLKDQPLLGELDTEWGMEIFYNVALTPWLQVTPDLQYVESGRPDTDDAVVLALRVQLYF